MLKRRDRIERLDRAIIETEIAITEQILTIVHAEARAGDTKTARRVLKTLYGLLAEYRHARDLVAEARKMTGRAGPSRSGAPAARAPTAPGLDGDRD